MSTCHTAIESAGESATHSTPKWFVNLDPTTWRTTCFPVVMMNSTKLGLCCLLSLSLGAVVSTGCATDQGIADEDSVDLADGKGDGISDLDQYNHYPTDRQDYQLDLQNLVGTASTAAFEYVNRVAADKFPNYTLQSFKTTSGSNSGGSYVVFFKEDRLGNSEGSHRCVKIKLQVSTSPTDAFPSVTRVKPLPNAAGSTPCKDNGEI